jgi:hypothetical protein
MRTISICTTLRAARAVLGELLEDGGPHAVVLVHEAVVATPRELGTPPADVFVSAEDARALGCDSPWANVDAAGLVRMMAGAQRVYVR